MKKGFIFDFDGVMIDNEKAWELFKEKAYLELFGKIVTEKLGNTLGLNMDAIYEAAVSHGATTDKETFYKHFHNQAEIIYKTAPITRDLSLLMKKLVELQFKIGVVSASPMKWIQIGLERIDFRNNIHVIISLYDREDLAHKPSPDGYTEAIKQMHLLPNDCIILEDSNIGIASAKAAGAFVIAFQQNLVAGQSQKGADKYAKTVKDVTHYVEEFRQKV